MRLEHYGAASGPSNTFVTGPHRTAMRLLRQEARPVWLALAAAMTVLLISVIAALAGPLTVQRFVDQATGGAATSTLVTIALIYGGVALVGGTARIGAQYFAVRGAWHIADGVRIQLLRRIAVRSSVLDVESCPVGEVVEKIEGDCDIVGRSIAESGFQMIGNVALIIGTLTVMVVAIPAVGVSIAALMIVVCLMFSRFARQAICRWKQVRDEQAVFFGLVSDSIAAQEDLLPLGNVGWATNVIQDKIDRLLHSEGRAYISTRVFWPLAQLFFAVAFGLSFGFGLQGLGNGSLSVGTLTMIYLYLELLQTPVEELASQWGQLQKTVAVLDSAAQTLSEKETDRDQLVLPFKALADAPLDVSFEHVSFSYGEVVVVCDVTFSVKPGESVGIIGQTGAGKSTLINLLCGLVIPHEGHVRIGGVDVDRIDPSELARRLSILSQRPHIFADSVRNNISLYEDSVTEEHIWQVLSRLKADSWVQSLPDGLDTVIGASGRPLSEGEQQRIACARVLIGEADLLIVDEGVSRLDPETEQTWSDLVETVMQERTVIMIEHRHEVIKRVDRVFSMAQGQITPIDKLG